jgi:hypothetical protein
LVQEMQEKTRNYQRVAKLADVAQKSNCSIDITSLLSG